MDALTPERCKADDPRLPQVLALIQTTFAFMEERIDPPSSMKKLTLSAIQQQCDTGEVWVLGTPPKACVFLQVHRGRLYLGKLAVDETARGRGHARRLVQLAERRAQALGCAEIELDVRIELVENHAAFAKLGFSKTSEGAHPGYTRPTFLTMRRPVPHTGSIN